MAQWKKIRQDQFIISFFSNNEGKKNTEYPLTLTSVHFSSATRLCAAHSEQDASVLTFSFFSFFFLGDFARAEQNCKVTRKIGIGSFSPNITRIHIRAGAVSYSAEQR